MRKNYFLPLVAALVLTGCANDDLAIKEGDSSASETRYLAISISSTDGGSFTRADGTTPTDGAASDPSKGEQYEEGSFTYEDGLAKENAVTGLRVYFFGPNGSPIDVKGNPNGGNFYDVPIEDISVSDPGANHEDLTVEKKINALVVVNRDEPTPSKIAVIVNPTPPLLAQKGPFDLARLRRFTNQYAVFANGENPHFVMTNSVYLESGNIVDAVQIMPENFQKTGELAKANPVTIYVERNVAKVRVRNTIPNQTALPDGGIMFPVLDKDTKTQITLTKTDTYGNPGDEVAVFVKFYGWDISADLQFGYLYKAIQRGWRNNVAGYDTWNDAANHRCYWADVCATSMIEDGSVGSDNTNQYFSYANGAYFKKKFNGDWKYCNENAEKTTGTKIFDNTAVLIKGELCDQDGNPLNITELANTRIIDDNSGTNLKRVILEMMRVGRDAHTHYKFVNGTLKEIGPEDITFVTASAANSTYQKAATPLTSGRYYVYAQLAAAASGSDIEWYTGVIRNAEGTGWIPDPEKKTTVEHINQHLYEMGHAKIWNSGKTYYYADILHSPTAGVAGVVRNHIYDICLDNVYGLGTPVYDPNEIIIPEKPMKDDTYVAAQIKILSWRLISSDVNLEWD